jgi:DNA repair exonuclease SbcCD ATPase subunit
MKTHVCFVIGVILLASCNNSEKIRNLETIANKNSLLLAEAQKKDSAIASYINTITEIQDNLDSIKDREKILSVNTGENKPGTKESLMADLKSIDDFIVSNDRKLNALSEKVKKLGREDIHLNKMVAKLNKELAQKDSEIVALQANLSKTDESLNQLSHKFNDSIAVIQRQRAEMNKLNDEVSTVYYVTGRIKELEHIGAVDKEGGFIGIGSTAELNPNAVSSSFKKANKVSLTSLQLNGKFRRLITLHPTNSYKISDDGKTDELLITNPADFWKDGNYLIVAVK